MFPPAPKPSFKFEVPNSLHKYQHVPRCPIWTNERNQIPMTSATAIIICLRQTVSKCLLTEC